MTTGDVSKILERLARIEEKLDAANTHDERLRKLESNRAALTAVIALLTFELQAAIAIATMVVRQQ